MKERRDGEESHERRQVPHDGLAADFLLQIELHVALKGGLPIGGLPDQRNATVRQNGVEREIGPELGGHEREQRLQDGASCQEVGPGGLQAPRARSEKDEPVALALDGPMDFIQERRQALDLVDAAVFVSKWPPPRKPLT